MITVFPRLYVVPLVHNDLPISAVARVGIAVFSRIATISAQP